MPVTKGKDGRWRYREVVRLPDGTRERISGTAPRHSNTKAATRQALLDHIEQARGRKREEVPAPAVPTMAAFFPDFMESYAKLHNKRSECIAKDSIFRNRILPFFGSYALSEIRRRDVEAFKGHLAKRLQPKSINNTLTVLRKILKYAEELELIGDVPGFRYLRVEKPDFDFLEFEELERLVAVSTEDAESLALLLCGAEAGLRVGEVRALAWADIDFVRSLVTVQRSDYRGELGSTKGGRLRRVPLTTRLCEALRAQQHARGRFVFCKANGRRYTDNHVNARVSRRCRQAGLRPISYHSLRHTFCSHLAMRGASIKAIQELAGHADIRTTLRYMHLSTQAGRAAIDLLEPPKGVRGKTWQKMPEMPAN